MDCCCVWRKKVANIEQDQELTQHDRLDTIKESLGEKGMPKFDPPIPKNHKELLVQNLISNNGGSSRPSKNSAVELQFSGWLCEDGDIWRSVTLPFRKLRLPTLRDYSSTISFKQFSKNISYELDRSTSSDRSRKLSSHLGSSICFSPFLHNGTLKIGTFNDNSMYYTHKSTVYGKCIGHVENCKVTLGEGEIIEGLEKIILEMSVGDEVIAFIPYHLAYGEQGRDQLIPPKANLVVQVLLQKIL